MKISAVLFAGGESRRLGRDKATLPWGKTTLWERQLQTLREISPVEILVSARTDPNWRPADIRFVKDCEPLHGPLSGLLSALLEMKGSHLLALAVDMPFVTAEYLQGLIEKCAPSRGACPYLVGRAEPLAAIYPKEALPVVEATHKSDADVSLRSLVSKLLERELVMAVEVDRAESGLFRNINRIEDLEQTQAIWGRAAR